MLKRIALVATFSSLCAFVFVSSAHAETHWSVHVGVGAPVAPPPVVAFPPPGYAWQPGYYAATPYGRSWVPATGIRGGYYNNRSYYNPGYRVGRGWHRDSWAQSRWRGEYRHRDRDYRR
jgi:hypothetical protein